MHAYMAFAGHTLISQGDLATVALAYKAHLNGSHRVALYQVDIGQVFDIDCTGTDAEMLDRLQQLYPEDPPSPPEPEIPPKSRGRGRPRLGVVSREISLLPRHWAWIKAQHRGASAVLRGLVEAARKADLETLESRQALNAAHSFIWDIAGDLPHFEAVTRILYSNNFSELEPLITEWPLDIRTQLMRYIERSEA